MITISGHLESSVGMNWDVHSSSHDANGRDVLVVKFFLLEHSDNEAVLLLAARRLKEGGISWCKPVGLGLDKWSFDPSRLRQEFRQLEDEGWLGNEKFYIVPKIGVSSQSYMFGKLSTVEFLITPEVLRAPAWQVDAPYDLQPYIARFQNDHGESNCAFLMMKYGETPLQKAISDAIRRACGDLGIIALRADDRAYAEDLLSNIRTYMHCCSLGVAVFERITEEYFNPNVSLEVGYMLALGKPVCLLKDSTLRSLHTDLVGRLYESFDVQRPLDSIPPVLKGWLRSRSLVP